MKNRANNNKKQRVRPEVKQEPLISSLSEEQQIAMGFRNPRIVTPDFSQTAEDKEKLKKVRRKLPISGGGMPRPKRNEPLFNLILHVKPNPSDKNYKSTVSFKARASEINSIVQVFVGKENVAKAFYAGKPYEI